MITIIAKKIDAKLSTHETNYERMDALIKYCARPQSKSETEKCVAVQAFNFSDDNPSLDRIIDEMTFDMTKSRRQDVELVSHWVISWKGGEPDIDKIFDSAKLLLEDLGYTDANRTVMAVHADTGHLHCHIAACKVDMWNGKLCREDWYKNEAQKSLARIADKFGWGLEPGARYRVRPEARKESLTVKTTQGSRKLMRKQVTKCENMRPSLASGAKKYEHRTGLKSAQRELQDQLNNFLSTVRSQMPDWKYGTFHRELAYRGIECRRQEHSGKFYTAFSLDGQHFFPASKVCTELSYNKLNDLLGGKSWRDARPDLAAIRNAARKKNNDGLSFLGQSPFTREEVARLKSIPAEKVYEILGKEPDPEPKDPVQILNSAGFDALSATCWLSEKFPPADRSVENPYNETLNRTLAEGARIDPSDLPRMRKIAEFMGALRTDQLAITTPMIDREILDKAASSGDPIFEINCKNAGLKEIGKLLPQIRKLEKYGVPVSCRPVWKGEEPVIIASNNERFFRAPASYPLPSINPGNNDQVSITVLANGRKSSVKAAVRDALLEVPKDELQAHMKAERQQALPIEKAPYHPYKFAREPLSEHLLKLMEQERKRLFDRLFSERQQAWLLSETLYAAGATPGQVFTALGGNDRARDLAMRMMPASFTGQQSAWRRTRLAQKPQPSLDQPDFSKDRPAPDQAKKYPLKPAKELKNVN